MCHVLSLAQAQAIRDRFTNGEKQEDLARDFNTTQATISRIVRNKVLTQERKRKLTPEQVQVIRFRRLTEKVSLQKLANDFQLTATEVKSITDGVTYQDVPPSEQELALRNEIRRLTETIEIKYK